ncbi:MAG: ABC transporter ATP-binding protein [Clostridia bacterium]|mgnify:FL=1|nr:ABC transporter ATP-binding protein [Clostridia bacterium]
MLKIENLVKKYGNFTAVDNLSLELNRGDIYGFVGPNGAGKTTTMRVVATLMEATSGTVLVDGINVAHHPVQVRGKIGYMPDFFGVYDNLKVDEYMDFYGSCYGLSKTDRNRRSDELLELVNLQDKKENYVDTLSRGMKQRLCLARSLIHNPELLILDEPASGMDPRARIEMKGILKALKDMNKTILISSHILHELAELCSSIGIIERGILVYSGEIKDIMWKLTGKTILEITVLSDVDKAVSLLREQPLVEDITGEDNTLEVSYSGSDDDMVKLLKMLINQDIPVMSFTKEEGSLEEVFMEVTKEYENRNME